MARSLLAAMAPTWAICVRLVQGWDSLFSSATVAATALSMPRFTSMGFIPALTNFRPSPMMAWARTVAVVVPSPAFSEPIPCHDPTPLPAAGAPPPGDCGRGRKFLREVCLSAHRLPEEVGK